MSSFTIEKTLNIYTGPNKIKYVIDDASWLSERIAEIEKDIEEFQSKIAALPVVEEKSEADAEDAEPVEAVKAEPAPVPQFALDQLANLRKLRDQYLPLCEQVTYELAVPTLKDFNLYLEKPGVKKEVKDAMEIQRSKLAEVILSDPRTVVSVTPSRWSKTDLPPSIAMALWSALEQAIYADPLSLPFLS